MTKLEADGAKVAYIGKRRCPVCGNSMVSRWRPFCSKRCADVDLGHWLKETYRIPVEEEDGSIPDEFSDDER
ncbi:MAG: DNA gyrase inhibitor YacG [Rhodospirillales bacterium]|nr:DNA gyrase inhibitor YacG [Rhodospirillales bacterium]